MGTFRTTAIQHPDGTLVVPTYELQRRVVQQFISNYTAGEWNPHNNYPLAPGRYVDITPRSADSRISYL